MKLGKRLKKIESLVNGGYTHIWDCCCDHGLLGVALLSRQAATYIHFVDIAPCIMAELEKKLKRFYPLTHRQASDSRWQTHCIDVAALPLQQCEGKQLIIIAGVGGELMATLVKSIKRRHSAKDIDFLLCPVNDAFMLRQQLIELECSLHTEVLAIENQRLYEILLVSTQKTCVGQASEISNTGNRIWQTDNPEQFQQASEYLRKTLAHYQRMQSGGDAEAQQIIEAYEAVTITLSETIDE